MHEHSLDISDYRVRAYSYVRMSTHKQLRGDSLRRQLERSANFAVEHNLILDDSLRDIGISAWKGKNFKTGALGRFLAMVENGEIPKGSYLLIESLDRLSREAVPDALTLFMAIINSGIIIATLGREDRQIYSRDVLNGDWTKLIIGLAVMSRGHEESKTKSERISSANQRKRDNARKGDGQITGLTPAWIDAKRIEGNRYEFSLNEHADTVRDIYAMAARGLGATAIAQHLNAAGTPTFKTDNGWYQSIIKLLLKRHDVVGTFQPHRVVDGNRVPDGDPIDGYFPAAVDKDLFLRVQSMRKLIGSPGRKGKSFANLFTGLCHCAHCHGPMSMKVSRIKAGSARYLVCSNHVRGHRCAEGRKNFRYDLLEQAVLDHVSELNLADAIQTVRSDAAASEMDERIAGLKLRLDELHRKEQRLAMVIEDDNAPVEVVLALLKLRQAERQTVEADLAQHRLERQRLSAKRHDPATTCDRIRVLRVAWQAAENDDARYSLRAEAHAAVREFVQFITFDSNDNAAMVVIANGLCAYTFRSGEMVSRFDAFGRAMNRQESQRSIGVRT